VATKTERPVKVKLPETPEQIKTFENDMDLSSM